MMPGYGDPNNQMNQQGYPDRGQPYRDAAPQGQGSGMYPPVNQPGGAYNAMPGSGAYPPVNQPGGAYSAMPGSGAYPPVNQPSGAYSAMPGSGAYPPVNQTGGAYSAMPGSGTYPPVNQQSGTYGAYADSPQTQSPEGWPQAREDVSDRNPFDETGFDPSLRDMRATRLMSHNDPFWEDFAKQQKKQRKREKKEARQAKKAARTGSYVGRKMVIAFAVIALVVFVLYSALYRVRQIDVRGQLYTYTQQQVAELAGIALGQSMADIDADDVAAHVNSNRYLIFRSVETVPLDTVILTVKERVPAAVLTFSGTKYLIDHRGMVLEESPSDAQMAGLPVISGIQIKGNYGCMVGSILKTESSAQFQALCTLLLELKVQSAAQYVTSINIANLDNILMETGVGYGVCLGDDTYIHGKVKAMLYVMGALAERRLGPGTIDVSNRQQPTYIPD